MRKISTLYAHGKTFIILKDSHGYWGIESKYVDKNGCLVENVNGLIGHLNKELRDTIRQCKRQALCDSLVERGYTLEDAIYFSVVHVK